MSEMKATVSSGRKFSAIWILPLVTLIVGLVVVVHSMLTQGPTITIDFATAEGLEVGKTKIRLLSVNVGVVESVSIKEDLSGVRASIKLDPETRELLLDDTRFWIVRARVGAGGISGLGTILSGAYIEMAPGNGVNETRAFVGLESPPLTPADAPGLRLSLYSDRAGSVSTGNAVLYHGYPVGRIEAMEFDAQRRQVRYDVFVDAPYHQLISSSTRFWDTSGIALKASAEGFEVDMGSMDTILLGGVAFGPVPGLPSGSPVASGKEYKLYKSYDAILQQPYRHGIHYVVAFSQSLRGLLPGSPVEYRGIEIGRVERLLIKELVADGMLGTGKAIPVLIYLEPGRLEVGDSEQAVKRLQQVIASGVRNNGLRASLQTGNLLTGKQLINLDYYPDEAPTELGKFEQYGVIPSIETGVARLEHQVSRFLDKLNALPLEATMVEVNRVLGRADASLSSLTAAIDSANSVLASDDTKALPEEMVATLSDLRIVLKGLSPNSKMAQSLGSSVGTLNATLISLDALIRQLSLKPNAILFPVSPEPDLIPEAHGQ
ncbi:MAG: intermembrane transport protein PqiB [Porticoccaceae bacterium]|nr:intermembrane transport protein PqiB [Porticoccaceae bacterium]